MSFNRQGPRPREAFLRRVDDGSIWVPDAVIAVNRSTEWMVTDHPVEEGVSVSDHIQRMPEAVTITAVVTESPNTGIGGIVHLQDRMQWLHDTADAKRLVDIVTRRRGILRGYAIQRLPENYDNVARLQFDLVLRQIRTATATAVQITVDNLSPEVEVGAPDEVDAGEQPTDEVDDPDVDPAVEDDRSILAGLLDALV